MVVPPTDPLRNPGRDESDQRRFRHARDRHVGFSIGRYLQPPPMLFTRDGHNVFLGDLYRGHTAFLVCAGPSLTTHDLTCLDQRGILTLAVNNAATVVRPRLWTAVDDPGNFCDAIWYDPGILKFVPLDHMEKPILVRNEQDKLVPAPHVVGDMPGVLGFRRNENFRPDQWLFEDTFNWGNRTDLTDADGQKGSRSVFYVALRLLFYLGVRTVYLLGCDFRMEVGRPNYAFDQERSPGSVRGNNSTYRTLNVRLERLKPYFDAEGFRVFNCTPESGLTVFPHVHYTEAVREARACVPGRIITAGMYDGRARVVSSPPAPVLPLTLVTVATPESLKALQWAWRTWEKYRPWLRGVPVLVCHPRSFDPTCPENRWLHDAGNVHFCVGPDEATTTDALRRWAIFTAASQHVDSPWMLFLAPTMVATLPVAGVDPEWFTPVEGGQPMFVASRTKPVSTERVALLDAWAANVAPSAEHAPVQVAIDGLGDNIFFARTEWFHQLLPVTTAPADIPTAALLGYLAAATGSVGRIVDFRQHGWMAARRPDRVAALARAALRAGGLV